MFWEKNKDLIILGIILVIVSIPILILLCPQVNQMIQAEAIVTLVFVTIFYAKQTQKLVEEGKKERTAYFWQQRLTEFYLPLKINLLKLQSVIQYKPFLIDNFIEALSEFTKLMDKGYMLSQEFSTYLYSFIGAFSPYKEAAKFEKTKMDEIFEKAGELIKIVNIEIRILEHKINETYGFYIDKKLKNLIDKLKDEWKVNHENKKRKKP